MAQRTCSVEGCERPYGTRGWCSTHYSRWVRTGDVTTVVQLRRPPPADGICSVPGCAKPYRTRGWCMMHYKRWWKYGDTMTPMRVRRPAPDDGLCIIPGCQRPHRTRGWCSLHLHRWVKHGDPLDPGPKAVDRPNGLRRCTACATEREVDQFCRSANRPGGLNPECRACAKAAYVRWARANPDKTREIGARKRARKLRVPTERIYPSVVFERDDWTCGICGGLIDASLRAPDGMSPSIDHIVPLAHQGSHTYVNIQAAHLRCNIIKGAKVG